MAHTFTFDGDIKVLKLLRCIYEINLTRGPKKYYLVQPEVRLLGHVVSTEGLQTDPIRRRSYDRRYQIVNDLPRVRHISRYHGILPDILFQL